MTPQVLTADLSETPDLISAPEHIFDVAAFRTSVEAEAKAAENSKAVRAHAVKLLATAQKAGRAAIAQAFAESPFEARRMTRSYTYLTDQLVVSALEVARDFLHRKPNPTASEHLAVIAVGGYGRGEMAPFSDVDLLFLTPYKITAWAESVIESMLYILWDLKLKVGHSSRTIKDCLRLGASDFTIQTAMLEHRFLAGDKALAQNFADRLRKDLFSGSGKQFVAAKLAEREARHKKHGQRYVLEPNVKEGKGGLRDLQSLYWKENKEKIIISHN